MNNLTPSKAIDGYDRSSSTSVASSEEGNTAVEDVARNGRMQRSRNVVLLCSIVVALLVAGLIALLVRPAGGKGDGLSDGHEAVTIAPAASTWDDTCRDDDNWTEAQQIYFAGCETLTTHECTDPDGNVIPFSLPPGVVPSAPFPLSDCSTTGTITEPVFEQCRSEASGMAACTGGVVNMTYLESKGYLGQDCKSWSLLRALRDGDIDVETAARACGAHRRALRPKVNSEVEGLRGALERDYESAYATGAVTSMTLYDCVDDFGNHLAMEGDEDGPYESPIDLHECVMETVAYVPEIKVCTSDTSQRAMCDNGAVNYTYFTHDRYPGQDCHSSGYWLDWRSGEDVEEEVRTQCSGGQRALLEQKRECMNCNYNKCCNTRAVREWRFFFTNYETFGAHVHVHSVQDIRELGGSLRPFEEDFDSVAFGHWAQPHFRNEVFTGHFKFRTVNCGSKPEANILTKMYAGRGALWVGSNISTTPNGCELTGTSASWRKYNCGGENRFDERTAYSPPPVSTTHNSPSCYTQRDWADCSHNSENWCETFDNGERVCGLETSACYAAG